MDHVIDYINEYMYSDVENLKTEYKSGQYKKLSQCPSYSTVQAYCNAINTLVKEYYNEEYAEQYKTSPKRLVRGSIRIWSNQNLQ